MPKYTIEVAGPHNEYLLFQPTHERLRGRWDNALVGHRDKGEMMKGLSRVHIIPGLYISLDTDKREGCRFDPLNTTEEGKRIWEQVSQVVREHKTEFGGEQKPWEPALYRDLTADQIKDWLWAMTSAFNAGYVRLVAGSPPLPTLDQIRKLPGKRTRDPGNTGLQTKGDSDDPGHLAKYVDIVPEGEGELVGAGASASGGPGAGSAQSAGGQGGNQGGGSHGNEGRGSGGRK